MYGLQDCTYQENLVKFILGLEKSYFQVLYDRKDGIEIKNFTLNITP